MAETNKDCGYVYMLKTREFINNNESVYKIGKTSNIVKRLQGYPKGSMYITTLYCNYYNNLEQQIIKSFKKEFIQRKDLGDEYFEGPVNEMVKVFQQLTKENIGDNEETKLYLKIPEITNTISYFNFGSTVDRADPSSEYKSFNTHMKIWNGKLSTCNEKEQVHNQELLIQLEINVLDILRRLAEVRKVYNSKKLGSYHSYVNKKDSDIELEAFKITEKLWSKMGITENEREFILWDTSYNRHTLEPRVNYVYNLGIEGVQKELELSIEHENKKDIKSAERVRKIAANALGMLDNTYIGKCKGLASEYKNNCKQQEQLVKELEKIVGKIISLCDSFPILWYHHASRRSEVILALLDNANKRLAKASELRKSVVERITKEEIEASKPPSEKMLELELALQDAVVCDKKMTQKIENIQSEYKIVNSNLNIIQKECSSFNGPRPWNPSGKTAQEYESDIRIFCQNLGPDHFSFPSVKAERERLEKLQAQAVREDAETRSECLKLGAIQATLTSQQKELQFNLFKAKKTLEKCKENIIINKQLLDAYIGEQEVKINC